MSSRQLQVARRYVAGFCAKGEVYGGRLAGLLDTMSRPQLPSGNGRSNGMDDTRSFLQSFGKRASLLSAKSLLGRLTCDALLLEASLGDRNRVEEKEHQAILVSKHLGVLSLHVHNEDADACIRKLSSDIIQIAKRFELFEEHARCLDLLQSYEAMSGRMAEVALLQSEMRSSERMGRLLRLVRSTWLGFLSSFIAGTSGWDSEAVKHELRRHLTMIDRRRKELEASFTLGYYRKLLAFALCCCEGAYREAFGLCRSILASEMQMKPVRSRPEKGLLLCLAAWCKVRMGEHRIALKWTGRARSLLSGRNSMYYFLRELEFLAHYSRGNSTAYATAASELAAAGPEVVGGFRAAKFKYHCACLTFHAGAFGNSLAWLRETNALRSDKSGWEVCVRLLVIMNLVETQRLDEADSQCENFYRLVHSSWKKGEAGEWEYTAGKLLRNIAEQGFVFENCNGHIHGRTRQLRALKESANGRVACTDLVCFCTWVEGKLNGGGSTSTG